MSAVRITVSATPGQHVDSTARTALNWDEWARVSGRNPLVVFIHNDTEVAVLAGDSVRSLTSRWQQQRDARQRSQS